MASTNARFKVTVSEQVWRMWDIEVEVDPAAPWLEHLSEKGVTVHAGAGESELLRIAQEALAELERDDMLPDPDHQESGSYSIEGFDVIVSPHDARVLDLLALREELT